MVDKTELSPLGCLPERTQGGPQVHLFSAYVTKSGRNDNLGTPMASSDLVVELEAPIAVLTLNRPRRRNALSMELMRKLTGELRSIASSGDIKVVIVAAQGPVFSSGHDLTEMIGKDVNAYREMFGACTDLMTTVQSIPQPVIAQVEGVATAAGCQLVASCDLAVASEASTFATPGVKIGLFCSTPMVPLTRAIGRKRALEMLLTGTPISAQTLSSGVCSIAWFRVTKLRQRRENWLAALAVPARSCWRSARRHSIRKSTLTSRKPTRTQRSHDHECVGRRRTGRHECLS